MHSPETTAEFAERVGLAVTFEDRGASTMTGGTLYAATLTLADRCQTFNYSGSQFDRERDIAPDPLNLLDCLRSDVTIWQDHESLPYGDALDALADDLSIDKPSAAVSLYWALGDTAARLAIVLGDEFDAFLASEEA